MRKSLLFLLALMAVVTIALLGAAEREIVAPSSMETGLPFSPGVRSGDFLFVSGTVGNTPGTRRLAPDIESQTRQALQNINQVLKAGGMDLSHVVSSNVFLADARHFQSMNEVYRQHFPADPPTRATVETDQVLKGALLEVAMVAARPGVSRRVIVPDGWQQPTSPYSWGILAGDTLFIAGMVSRDPRSGQTVSGDIQTQTRQVLQNVGTVLESAGMDHSDVVSSRVFLSESRDFQAMNETYRSFFKEDPPVRATVRARLASMGMKIEVQCVAVRGGNRKVVGTPRPNSPFSPGIQVGERLYLSGMVGRGPKGFAAGDIKAQTHQTLKNLRTVLRAGGLDFRNVVDATVFLTDIRYYDAMNEVYREVVGEPFPARATVGTQLMGPQALIEIMMTAAR